MSKWLTSERDLNKKKKTIQATNKQRSRAMESRVAKYLGGLRTPMSGAMKHWKGDCEIPIYNPLNDSQATYLIECKLSSQVKEKDLVRSPSLMLDYKWFEKIRKEAQYDGSALFGIVVIHFHNHPIDYVFIHVDDLKWLDKHGIIRVPEPLDWRYKANNGLRRIYTVTKALMEDLTSGGFGSVVLQDGQYLIMTLPKWKEIAHGA